MNCLADDCKRKKASKGYCNMHYHRLVRHGNANIVKFVIGRTGCIIEGCEKEHTSLGYCYTHYTRLRKYGDPTVSKNKGRHFNQKGYAFVPDPSGKLHTIAEHRLVMQQHLGRKLAKGENVHHLNGDRQDNRLQNLELWNTSQPSGQRTEDKVKFAIGILSQYAPHLLKLPIGRLS